MGVFFVVVFGLGFSLFHFVVCLFDVGGVGFCVWLVGFFALWFCFFFH